MSARTRFLAALTCALLAPQLAARQAETTRELRVLAETSERLLREESARFLAAHVDPNLLVSDATRLSLVVLRPGALGELALGWFTYEVDGRGGVRVLDVQRFDLASGSPVLGASWPLAGARGAPRTFHRGERIGLFLEPADEPGLRASAANERTAPRAGPATATTLESLHPGMRRAAMAWMPPLQGFAGGAPFPVCGLADLTGKGSAAPSFADVVFALVPSSGHAIAETRALDLEAADRDGDGLADLYDAAPDDAARAFLERIPRAGRATLALEEDYPELGDHDYNDALVHCDWSTLADVEGRVRDVLASFDLLSRRSRFDHRLMARLPLLPEGTTGTVEVERFWGQAQQPELERRTIAECLARHDGCAPVLIPSTRGERPKLRTTRSPGAPSELLPASARVRITFDPPVEPRWLGAMPLEPFFVVLGPEFERDVHVEGARPLGVRDPRLPPEQGARSFVSRSGYPHLLLLPLDWSAPADGVAVWDLYPGFRAWIGSQGARSADWHLHPDASDRRWTPDPRPGIPERAWTLQLPLGR